jgi:arylsulfatase
MDILPTCLEIAGAEYPAEINGLRTWKPDGKSLVPMLYGTSASVHDTLYWEHEGGRAIRTGNWKMASLKGKSWELFDLSADRTETVNLAGQYPEKVRQMDESWRAWSRRVNEQ